MSELSGKMVVLDRLLCEMRARGNERIVIVSNFTQTLDQIGLLCKERFFPVVRLDGSMAVKKRRVLVEEFCDPDKNQFAFLLSSKAGGCGLNLIGANRLILFDPDWNPATDKQAAARVWRDGQKRRCYVYRFLTAGTIEEKVFQRQLSKEGLQSIVVDDKMTVNAQSGDELKDIFTLEVTPSSTHASLKCKRCSGIWGCGEGKGGGKEEDLQTWAHHCELSKVRDKAFQKAAGTDVSFVFGLKYPGQRFAGWKCEDDTDDEAAGAADAGGGAAATPVVEAMEEEEGGEDSAASVDEDEDEEYE
jgi:DNA repair and recombination RAD54-like protein